MKENESVTKRDKLEEELERISMIPIHGNEAYLEVFQLMDIARKRLEQGEYLQAQIHIESANNKLKR